MNRNVNVNVNVKSDKKHRKSMESLIFTVILTEYHTASSARMRFTSAEKFDNLSFDIDWDAGHSLS